MRQSDPRAWLRGVQQSAFTQSLSSSLWPACVLGNRELAHAPAGYLAERRRVTFERGEVRPDLVHQHDEVDDVVA